MFIRRAFTTFLDVRSEAPAPVSALIDWTITDLTIDWRWFGEAEGDDGLPSEGSLINWPAWARLTTPRHA
ncbi:MAG: hypothetical protein U1E60_10665 [Reyranellaceae bacterium]